MKSHLVRRFVGAAVVAVVGVALSPMAQAAPPVDPKLQAAPGASAHSIGLYVDALLLQQNISAQNFPGNTSQLGPLINPTYVESSQAFPPASAAPDENALIQVPGIPDSGGALVQSIGAITTLAGATGLPQAVASAQAVDVRLLAQGGVPTIQADVIRGQANADCTNDPNADGTQLVNLVIGGQAIPVNVPPNTDIPLGLLIVRVNEQHPAADGRGIVVNAIHVFSTTTGDALFRGDIIVGHASATVNCPNGKGTTGGNSPILMTKDAAPQHIAPGGTVTYSASIQNKATDACLVNAFVDHLPAPFEFVSTSGDLGTAGVVADRHGGGQDMRVGQGITIAPGATVHQTIVLKVKDDAAPGIYFNNLELFCANLGNYVKGLDAPVEITAASVPSKSPAAAVSDLPKTGGAAAPLPLMLAGAVVIGAAVVFRAAKPGRI